MQKVLFDTNIILDIALKRNGFFDQAKQLFSLVDERKITAFVTATTLTDLYYIIHRHSSHKLALAFLKDLIKVVDILGVDKQIVLKALESNRFDFEDSIQIISAQQNRLDCIVTRNIKDFTGSPLKVITPLEFINEN